MKKLLLSLAAISLLAAGCPSSAPVANPSDSKTMAAVIERPVGENGLQGMYFVPSKHEGKLPGLLVIHEWWGLNEQI